MEVGREPGVEVVPLYFTTTGPLGMISADAFERISAECLQLLKDNGPWDGILLVLHGAAVSEEYHDADGEFARRVRALVGPEMPIGVSMDLHGNLTPLLVESVSVVDLYRTNPHLDARIRARECAELIVRAVRGEVHPVAAHRDAAAGRQHRQAVHRRGADARHDGGCRGGRPVAGDALGQRRDGLPLRRCAGDGHVVHRRP